MSVDDLVRLPNLGLTFEIDGVGKKFDVKIDDTTIVKDAAGVISAGTIPASSVGVTDAAGNYTGGDVEAVLAEIATTISGIAHTAITGIDLKPTGVNPNEFTVEISWTDENGTAQTTTDPTPITMASATVVSTDAGNLVTAGTDGGALLTSTVSGDAGNLVVQGGDGLAFLNGAAICAEITANCFEDCVVTDMFGDVIGTVQQLQ